MAPGMTEDSRMVNVKALECCASLMVPSTKASSCQGGSTDVARSGEQMAPNLKGNSEAGVFGVLVWPLFPTEVMGFHGTKDIFKMDAFSDDANVQKLCSAPRRLPLWPG